MSSINKQVKNATARSERLLVERVQTGVKIEKRLLKVLKGLAEYHEMSLGDLLEGVVLHALDGKNPFGPASLKVIGDLKQIYKLELDSNDSHKLIEAVDRGQTPVKGRHARRSRNE